MVGVWGRGGFEGHLPSWVPSTLHGGRHSGTVRHPYAWTTIHKLSMRFSSLPFPQNRRWKMPPAPALRRTWPSLSCARPRRRDCMVGSTQRHLVDTDPSSPPRVTSLQLPARPAGSGSSPPYASPLLLSVSQQRCRNNSPRDQFQPWARACCREGAVGEMDRQTREGSRAGSAPQGGPGACPWTTRQAPAAAGLHTPCTRPIPATAEQTASSCGREVMISACGRQQKQDGTGAHALCTRRAREPSAFLFPSPPPLQNNAPGG